MVRVSKSIKNMKSNIPRRERCNLPNDSDQSSTVGDSLLSSNIPIEKFCRCFRKDKWLYVSGFEMASKHNITDKNAVYVIYLDGKLSYVGQSNTPRFRFQQHKFRHHIKYETPWGEFDDMYCKMKYPSQYGKETMIEKRLIRKLNPRYNINKYKKRTRGK